VTKLFVRACFEPFFLIRLSRCTSRASSFEISLHISKHKSKLQLHTPNFVLEGRDLNASSQFIQNQDSQTFFDLLQIKKMFEWAASGHIILTTPPPAKMLHFLLSATLHRPCPSRQCCRGSSLSSAASWPKAAAQSLSENLRTHSTHSTKILQLRNF
jgi:hypothetical protein